MGTGSSCTIATGDSTFGAGAGAGIACTIGSSSLTVCGTAGNGVGGCAAFGVSNDSDLSPGDFKGGGTAVGGAVSRGVGGNTDGLDIPAGLTIPRNDGAVAWGLSPPVAGGVVTIGGGISTLSRRPSVGSVNLDARLERKEPIPTPHEEIAGRAGEAAAGVGAGEDA
jgi:hypothetical protein